jgi:hypothetical protein
MAAAQLALKLATEADDRGETDNAAKLRTFAASVQDGDSSGLVSPVTEAQLNRRVPSARCPDCGVWPGQVHQEGCDVERCRRCGGQAIACNCVYEVCLGPGVDLERDHPAIFEQGPTEAMEAQFAAEVQRLGGRLPWTGTWPGVDEAAALGWYCLRNPTGSGYVPCASTDPDAQPDLNRLAREAHWDAALGQFVAPLYVMLRLPPAKEPGS